MAQAVVVGIFRPMRGGVVELGTAGGDALGECCFMSSIGPVQVAGKSSVLSLGSIRQGILNNSVRKIRAFSYAMMFAL